MRKVCWKVLLLRAKLLQEMQPTLQFNMNLPCKTAKQFELTINENITWFENILLIQKINKSSYVCDLATLFRWSFLLFHIVSCPFATNCRLIEKDDLWFDQWLKVRVRQANAFCSAGPCNQIIAKLGFRVQIGQMCLISLTNFTWPKNTLQSLKLHLCL